MNTCSNRRAPTKLNKKVNTRNSHENSTDNAINGTLLCNITNLNLSISYALPVCKYSMSVSELEAADSSWTCYERQIANLTEMKLNMFHKQLRKNYLGTNC